MDHACTAIYGVPSMNGLHVWLELCATGALLSTHLRLGANTLFPEALSSYGQDSDGCKGAVATSSFVLASQYVTFSHFGSFSDVAL